MEKHFSWKLFLFSEKKLAEFITKVLSVLNIAYIWILNIENGSASFVRGNCFSSTVFYLWENFCYRVFHTVQVINKPFKTLFSDAVKSTCAITSSEREVQKQPPRLFSQRWVFFFQEHLFLNFPRRLHILFTEQKPIFQEDNMSVRRTNTNFNSGKSLIVTLIMVLWP